MKARIKVLSDKETKHITSWKATVSFASRGVTDVHVLTEETSGVSLAFGTTEGGPIEHLGDSPFDALDRLGTLAVRQFHPSEMS